MSRRYLIVVLLLVVTAAVFSEVPRMAFVDWDDSRNVSHNPYLNPVTLGNALHFWKQPYYGFYIPVTRTVWAAIAYFAQVPPDQTDIALDPGYFHVANLVVHLLNVLLVFAILRTLMGADWPAAAGAALFALHPLQVESVAWVTGMKDLLGGFFGLVALWQYLLYAVQTRDDAQARWRRLHYALALVAFALAVLSKQTVVVLPLAAWALDHWALRRPTRECTWAVAGWIPIAAGAAVVARLTSGAVPQPPPIWARLFVAGDYLAFYLSKLAFPVRLGCHYARKPELVLANWWGYATWAVPAALGVGLWVARRRAPALVAGFVVFAAGLLPVLGLLPFANQDVCDRFMYLSMLGPALALAWALSRADSKLLLAACAGALAALGCLSLFQTLHWHNTVTLFTHAVQVNPRSVIGHNILGAALIERGRAREAYLHYRVALSLDPGFADTYDRIGVYFFYSGDTERAIEHFRQALRLQPNRADTHYNLGAALIELGKYREAEASLREALRYMPEVWYLHHNLAVALHRQARYRQAEHHYREAIRIRPSHALSYFRLGELYRDTGRVQEAGEAFAEAERLGGQSQSARPPQGGAPLPEPFLAPGRSR